MKKLTLLFSILTISLLFYNCINAQTLTPKYNVSMAPISQGYYEYLPKGYAANGTTLYPLILFIHGSSERGSGDSADLPLVLTNATANQIGIQKDFPDSFVVAGKTYEFIVLMPQICCWPGAQASDLDAMIDYSIQNYNVDSNRIYLTGLSEGGASVWLYAGYSKAYASRVAAIVPIAGADSPTVAQANNIAAGNVAVWATHNSGDTDIPPSWTINFVNDINAAPVPPTPLARKTIFNASGHDAWDSTVLLTYNFAGTNPPLNVYQWMLQYSRSSNIILPVTEITLNVQKNNSNVLLTWKTHTEINNRGFEIQRSSNGTDFSSIGFVVSQSIDGNGAEYSFTDPSPLYGKNYYRIQEQYMNNATTLSQVQVIDFNAAGFVKLYPNPATDIINITTNHILNNAMLKIYNAGGQLIKQVSLNGSGTIAVSVKDLPSTGIYLAQITEATGNTNLRFIKQ